MGEEKESAEQGDDEEMKTDDKAETDSSDIGNLKLSDTPANPPAAPVKTKGRVIFIYTCPSGSPIKFRMVYSSGVRGMQDDAKSKAGIDISSKVGIFRSGVIHG